MKTECTTDRFTFQPLGRREVVGAFDGGTISSDAGGLLLREVEQRTGIIRQFAACFLDHRDPDLIEHTVYRGDGKIDLLPREFKLLEYFLRHPGQVITRAMLLRDVWQYHFSLETNVVDVHISNLRKKIDARGAPSLIVNIRGAGFMLSADA